MPAVGKKGGVEKRHEFVGLTLITLALLFLLSLLSYSPNDPAFSLRPLPGQTWFNLVGPVGMAIAASAFVILGAAAYILPMAFGVLGGRCFLLGGVGLTLRSALGFLSLLVFLAAAAALRMSAIPTMSSGWAHVGQAGGYVGHALSTVLVAYFALVGAHILLAAAIVLSILMATPVSVVAMAGQTAEVGATLSDWVSERWEQLRSRRKKVKPRPRAVKIIRSAPPTADQDPIAALQAPDAVVPAASSEPRRKKKGAAKAEELEEVPLPDPRDAEGFILPSADLLTDAPLAAERVSDAEIRSQAAVLTSALANFGINGQVIQTHVGPVVTMYEFEPAPGVKVARIVNLADDLALALKALSIRIVAPIPGKAVVGIEVPNPRREDVVLKEILSGDAFTKLRSPLKLALGKDIFGKAVVADLRGMPHLLVAGATGSGKSVGLNTMILSILFTARPNEVKFLMIDPKMLELTDYEGIPHLWRPVITEPKAAARGLLLAVREMERRYKVMAQGGARNIETYNRTVSQVQGVLPFQAEDPRDPSYLSKEEPLTAGEATAHFEPDPKTALTPLPYLVIVIDELADLMMIAAKEVEDSIARLAQMARAAGIHLILATQRPSVDVLTGIIKANFPARIAFQVASKTDSRTILDQNGAEQLLGRGDMLYLATGSGKLTRVHGAFVPDADLKKAVDFIKSQSQPVYADEPAASSTEGSPEESDRDEMYEKAKDIVIGTGQASASFLQRRLRVGYPRAARLVEMMEQDGIVGAPSRDGRREVLVKKVGVDEGSA